ncbi:MAG: DUF4384 domain-containing protein [Bryobacteraceae bacterium]
MKSLFVLTIAASAAWAQSNGSLRARELFYTPPPTTAAAKPLASAVAKPPVPAAPKETATKKAGPMTTPTQATATAAAPATTAAPATAARPTEPAKTQAPVVAAAPAASSAVPTRMVSNAPVEAIPLGMRYAVLRRNAANKFVEIDPESTFRSGDRIRLEMQANSAGYLYVVAQGSSGAWQVLFPSKDVAGGSNAIHRGEVRQIPAGDRGQFVFDEQAGTEKLFLVLTRQPENSLEKLIYAVQGAPAPAAAPAATPAEPPRMLMASAKIGDDVISRIRGQMQSRDLIFEKVENDSAAPTDSLKPTGAPEEVKFSTANYVVNPSTSPDARVVVDISLIHK